MPRRKSRLCIMLSLGLLDGLLIGHFYSYQYLLDLLGQVSSFCIILN